MSKKLEKSIKNIIQNRFSKGFSIGGNTITMANDEIAFPSGSNSSHMKFTEDYIQFPDGSQESSAAPPLDWPQDFDNATLQWYGINWAEDIKDYTENSYAYWDSLDGWITFNWSQKYKINYYNHYDTEQNISYKWELKYLDDGNWKNWCIIPSSCYSWSGWTGKNTIVTSSLRMSIYSNPSSRNLSCGEMRFKYSSQ